MIDNINFELNSDFFKDTDLNFLKDIPNAQKELNFRIETLTNIKDELSRMLTDKNCRYIEFFSSPTDYLNSIHQILDNVYKQITNYNSLRCKLNNIEKCLLKLIESLNFTEANNNGSIKELNKQISGYKVFFKKDDEEYNTCLDLYNELKQKIKPVENESVVVNVESAENVISSVIPNNSNENDTLIISEIDNKIILPYTTHEINKLLEAYPDIYKTASDVIEREFTLSYSLCKQNPVIARFREAYYLYRNKEMRSIWESFIFAKDLMFMKDLLPAVIAAVKSEKQLNSYLECLKNNRVKEDFKYFKIEYKIRPALT